MKVLGNYYLLGCFPSGEVVKQDITEMPVVLRKNFEGGHGKRAIFISPSEFVTLP